MTRGRLRLLALVALAVAALAVGLFFRFRHGDSNESKTRHMDVVAVGDIARCDGGGDEETAKLVERTDAQILALGDLAYGSGSAEEFRDCFDPAWGALRERIHPAPGNHEYETPGARGYFDYFGEAAGDGYYSFDLGAWHIISLNSNCEDHEAGCAPGDPQLEWLGDDLRSTRAGCVLAYWHHPRFSSGEHGDDESVAGFWALLDENGADLVLNGHDHDYERFAPQGPSGEPSTDGIREFVVGTGGGLLRDFSSSAAANSEFRLAETFGVLELSFRPGSYEWRFVTTDGKTADQGSDRCH